MLCAFAGGYRCFLGGEVLVHRFSGLAAFRDSPDHERLTTAHVAGCEDVLDGALEVRRSNIAARIERQAKLFDHAIAHRAEEAHGEQNEIDFERELGTCNLFELRRRSNADSVYLLHVAVLVASELERIDCPVADAAFFVRGFGAKLHGPERPRC